MHSQRRMTRSATLAALDAGAIVGPGDVLPWIFGSPQLVIRLTDDGSSGGGTMAGPWLCR